MENTERIHVLGIGNIGKLFAHSIARLPNAPPITLLLHRQGLVEEFLRGGKTIDIVANGVSTKATGFDFETIGGNPEDSISQSSNAPISNLIVATKTTQTLSALSSISHRLTPKSTLLFAQNGVGAVDEVNDTLFPDAKDRPSYLTAIISHGIYTTGAFSSVHAGFGTTKIGFVEDSAHRYPEIGSTSPVLAPPRRLIDIVLSASVLSATEYPPAELVKIQLEKLVMNAMLNPLTSIFRVRNGMLFGNPSVLDLMHVLVREASQILIAYLGDGSQDTASRFGEENLERLVLDVAVVTAKNRSSMLQDVESGRQTEIDYINGWFVKKGKEYGIKHDNHARLVDMVKQSQVIRMDEVETFFPDVRAEGRR